MGHHRRALSLDGFLHWQGGRLAVHWEHRAEARGERPREGQMDGKRACIDGERGGDRAKVTPACVAG